MATTRVCVFCDMTKLTPSVTYFVLGFRFRSARWSAPLHGHSHAVLACLQSNHVLNLFTDKLEVYPL